MPLNGIDVASYQTGIDPANIPYLDFVIAKATEGTSYLNPAFEDQITKSEQAGKLIGAYHYVNGSGATAEADYFWSKVKHLKGKAIFAIDWESGGNTAWSDEGYLKTLVRRFIDISGIKPLIYASKSSFPWKVAEELDCGTWVAQYASTNPTGWQVSPWNEYMYSCTIRQYASTGQLDGWNGNLDLNKAYLTKEQWMAYAGKQEEKPKPGWHKDDKGWWYVRSDGSYPVGQWKQINKEWYYFDNDGYAVTGWKKINNFWYYLNTADDGIECAMHKGWLIKDNKAYYLRPKVEGKNPEGSMVEGTTTIKCTFDINGHLEL